MLHPVQDLELSPQQLGSLLWRRFDSWLRNFHMPWAQAKKKKRKKPQRTERSNLSRVRSFQKGPLEITLKGNIVVILKAFPGFHGQSGAAATGPYANLDRGKGTECGKMLVGAAVELCTEVPHSCHSEPGTPQEAWDSAESSLKTLASVFLRFLPA